MGVARPPYSRVASEASRFGCTLAARAVEHDRVQCTGAINAFDFLLKNSGFRPLSR
jgi:hypothetical protein